ncbi:hypothetical protein BJX76DRAFT_347099 [Aspergillus varians]
MSSLLQEVGTPCPRRSKGSRASDESGNGSDPFDSLWDNSLGDYDDTRNIDFTTEIRAPILTGAKPKRRAKTSTSFNIHSDHDEKHTQATLRPKRDIKPAIGPSNRKTSLLAQPAQRFRPRVSFAPSPLKNFQQRVEIEPRKQSTRSDVQKNNDLLRRISDGEDGAVNKDVLKKDVRRNTVYIPPEDTTVASVFMGLFSPLKSKNLENYISENTEVGSLESQIARKQQAKRLVASSSGRCPLQPSSKITQESCLRADVPGKNGGKENIPPGGALIEVKGKKFQSSAHNEPLRDKLSQLKLADNGVDIISRANGTTKPFAARTVNKPVKRVESQAAIKISVSSSITEGRRPLNTRAKDPAMRSSTRSNPLKTSISGMSSASRSSLKYLNHKYPLVSESITNPEMYDDNWLSHQEVILTQLINELFSHTSGGGPNNPANLRHDLLLLYQDAHFTNLYKRLQASLVYGALSIPKDVILRNSRLRQDLGMKRKFIDIWIQTYKPNALRAALETVTGRVIPITKASSSNFQMSADQASLHEEKTLTKRIARFLDTFLVQNQDMNQNNSELGPNDGEALADVYRRTVLRSIMMVILLDKARTCPKTSLSGCLFRASSPYKSSLAVLQALARVLLPSCGDVGKAVAQLDCQFTYEQHPLEEYEYEMTNLAVDLRDGVRLTRIVELLLYPSVLHRRDASDTSNTTTSSANSSGGCQWPLSKHLKFPCLGRAVKIFNVNTALDALASTTEGKQLVSNIRGTDLVDGHREKTIALLWGLVTNWGLSGLVDMDALREEIGQLRHRAVLRGYKPKNLYAIDEHTEIDKPALLLKQWASVVAQLRGLHSENFITDLADGKVYECIVDEYGGYILACSQTSMPAEGKAPLEDRLRALGCSTEFIKIVSPGPKAHLLNSHSTTGALVFLCSRLLPATKRVRAALVLQNAWRRVLDHRDAQKRAVARDVARECAAVVQTRDRILWAKGVIVNWWRLSRANRQRRITSKTAMSKTMTKTKMYGRTSTKIPLRCGK